MKKISFLLIALLLFGCSNNNSTSLNQNPNSNISTSQIQEGKLYIKSVTQYISYAPVDIEIYMDKVLTPNMDLYYDIIDPSICEIKDNKVYGLKVGETTVYAQTILGQEVSFDVRIKNYTEYIYDRDTRSREEEWKLKESPKHGTLFIGDSFFDKFNFWKSFDDDFEDKNCFTMGISGSQTKDWLMVREKLINQVEAKNIVIHIGTNDINDNSISKDIDEYYYDIAKLLDTISNENPNANIYYFGIENRVNNPKNKTCELVTAKIKDEYGKINEKFTYIDSPSVFNANQDKYISSDGVHPSRAGYEYYIETLNNLIEY